MAFSVIRSNHTLVKPCERTPFETLELSFIDKLPALQCYTRTLHVFRHEQGSESVDTIIKEGLAKALVPYYPLAGRLKEANGHLQVECSGEGVWFVVGSANSTLHNLDYFDNTACIPYDALLPDSVPNRSPLVQMQITKFECGGFVVGLIFCHTICDGLGAAQFLTAIGELARGLDHLTITPQWHRHFLSTTLNQPNFPTFAPPFPTSPLEHANIDMPIDTIKTLKQQFHDLTGYPCSSFEIVAARFWRERTKSISFVQDTKVKLVFFANCRQLFDPPLPEGFYGNCFFPVTITTYNEILTQGSIYDVVKLIQEAKAKLPIEFSKYVSGEYLENGGDDPFAPPLEYTTLFISEWARLGFDRVDYGFGCPVHVVPVQGSSIIPVGIVGSLPLPNKGVRLMTWCVEEKHRTPFINLMTKLD